MWGITLNFQNINYLNTLEPLSGEGYPSHILPMRWTSKMADLGTFAGGSEGYSFLVNIYKVDIEG